MLDALAVVEGSARKPESQLLQIKHNNVSFEAASKQLQESFVSQCGTSPLDSEHPTLLVEQISEPTEL